MADKQISELTQATQITDVDLFVLEQDGTAKKLTGATLLDFVTLSVVNVTVTTLPAGSQATAVYNKATGVLALGIPQGDKGETGETGATGATGPAGPQGETPNIQIGKVSTLPTGMSANASITGTTENPLLNLGLPKGDKGSMWYVQARNPISAGVNVRLGDIWSNSNGYVYRAEYNAQGKLNFVSTGLTIKGATGATGPAGADGADGVTPHIGDNGNWFLGDTDTGIVAEGATPNIQIGEVTTLPAGSQATASMGGTAAAPLLNLGIPKGDKGDNGDAGGGTAIDLGVTGAAVGDIIKVAAVDADGKPAAWEAAELAGGDEWEKIADVALTADTSLYELANFGVYRKVKVIMSRAADVSELKKNVWFRIKKESTSTPYAELYMTTEYGYLTWEVTGEIGETFTWVQKITTNNPVMPKSAIKTVDILSPANPSEYGFYIDFTDTSVIQNGDTVSVYGVKR